MKLERVVVLLALALPVSAQYAGPAILTRGEAPVAMAAPQINFRPFLEIAGIYDTGLAAVAVTDQGGLANQSSAGVSLAWGLSGTHSWRHTKIGLDYRGDLNHYTRTSAFDSLDQSLLLGVTHQLSRHIVFTVRASAGIFSRDFGLAGLPQTVPFDPTTSYVPTTDFFDNRTIYLSTVGDVIYQRTARLSFDFGGGGSIVRRRSTALDGTVAETAHGDVQYRLSRLTTIGATYRFDQYSFTHIFGGTDIHSVGGTLAIRLTRWLEFTGGAGVSRAESKFEQLVAINPVIAALLGITEGTQVVHTIDYVPNLTGRLSRTFKTGVAYVSGGHSVLPGNGLFLTSYATTVLGGYTYTGVRRWSLGIQADYTHSKSIGNILGTYSDISGGFTASRQIIPSLHFVSQYSARHYSSPNFSNYNRLIHEAKVGLGWSPGDVPLRIW